jgi:hypothetical protein
MAGKSTEVAVPEGGEYAVLFSDQGGAVEVMRENLGEGGISPLDLDRVGIPAGGGTSWEVPTLEGSDSVREIQGIVVAWRSPRVYWSRPIEETGGGVQPDCSSDDGVFGRGMYGKDSDDNPSGRCDQCPMDQWGSDPREDSRAKACKEMRSLFVLRPNTVLPIVVSLPPTSILPLRKYFMRLVGHSVPYYGAVTRLGLERVQSGGFTWSVAEPSLVRVLDEAELAASKAYSTAFQASLEPAGSSDAAGEAYLDGATKE